MFLTGIVIRMFGIIPSIIKTHQAMKHVMKMAIVMTLKVGIVPKTRPD
jgi:hypothetical protein